MPWDATSSLGLEELNRQSIFSQATPLTNALAVLYLLWGGTTPVLHDALPIVFIANPDLCPAKPMRIAIDEKGLTRVDPGRPNANVCLQSDQQLFFKYFMGRFIDSNSE
jgi:inosine-uridine nucleoside N-ribohydrolase